MSSPGPDDSSAPSLPTPELAGLDPKELLQAGLETIPPVTLPPQPVDSDATIPVARPQSTQPAAQVELPLPEELTKLLPGGNYHVESFLGQGGMGAVYKGMQVRLKRPVAIKIMRRDMGKDYDFEARFEREAQAMAKLNHPNIVSVIDFGEAGPDYLYIVMELIDGADLMDVIRCGQMTQEMALSLLPQICDALQFAHDHGIVHRDIKPSNIMLTRDGRVKMCDFGLAKRYDVESSFRTQTGTGMGTPDYAAPEQFDPKANIDHRADIYALGVMIYQMITGQLPRGVWKPPSQRAEVAPQWDDIVSRAMQSDPSDRYQQASEVKTDVTSIPLGKEGSANERSAGTPARLNQSGGAAAKNHEAVRRAEAQRRQPAEGSPKGERSEATRAPVKSRAALAIGSVVIGLIAFAAVFFALKKPEESRRGHQTADEATSTSDTATPPRALASAPTPAPALPESGWKPLVSQTEWQADWDGGEVEYRGKKVQSKREYRDNLLQLINTNLMKNQTFRDGAIRATVVVRDNAQSYVVGRSVSGLGTYQLGMVDPTTFRLILQSAGSAEVLGTYNLPQRLKVEERARIELRIQGDHLTGILNGALLIDTHDRRLIEAGEWGIAGSGWFESVEVQPLPAATTPAPIAAPALPESGWKPLVSQTEWQKYSKSAIDYQGQQVTNLREYKDGLLHLSRIGLYGTQPFLDGAIRARLVMRVGSEGGGVSARNFSKQRYFFNLADKGTVMVLSVKTPDNQAGKTLGSYRLPKPLQPDEKFTIELRIQGDQLTGLFNGQEVVRATDQRVKEVGTWGIDAADAWFESVEVQSLPAAATPAPLAAPALPESGWKPLLTDAEWHKSEPGKLEFKNGMVHSTGGMVRLRQPWRNGAVRAAVKFQEGSKKPSVIARSSVDGFYQLQLAESAQHVQLLFVSNTSQKSRELGVKPLPEKLNPGDTLRLELRAQGDQLAGLVNGAVVIEAHDVQKNQPASWGFYASDAWFESVEVQPLPAAPEGNIIRLFDTADKLPKQLGVAFGEFNTLKVDKTLAGPDSPAARDLIFRTSLKVGDDNAGGASLYIRYQREKHSYSLGFYERDKVKAVELRVTQDGKVRAIKSWPLPGSYQPSDWLRLEIKAIGPQFTVSADGQVLGTVEDATLTEAGGVRVGTQRTGFFKDIEYVPLDAPAAERWQNALADPAQLSLSGGAQVTKDGLLLTRYPSQALVYAGQRRGDGAIRMRAGADGLRQGLRVRSHDKGNHYNLDIPNQTTLKLQRWDNVAKQSTVLREFPLPPGFNLNAEHEIELRAEGSTLTVSLDRQILGSATDAAYPTGSFGVSVGDPITKPVLIKKLEFLDLGTAVSPSPSPPVSASSVATATKEAPFTNSLGMKFVPMPGTQVLFSIWHTRVQDYAEFAKAQEAAGKKVDGAWKTQQKDGAPVGREADHPVVGVSWEDAQAFCQWLTAKESAEGKLAKGQRYRLPTDEEWSTAVGLPPEQGATPEERSGKSGAFPWGRDWPPSPTAGNYGDETFHAKFPPKKNENDGTMENEEWIEGYTDSYAVTSPVGSFPPSTNGLHDMGGNVLQWCEDWWNAEQSVRVARGTSWRHSERLNLRSTIRSRFPPTLRADHTGFRCVLQLAPSTTAVSPATNLPVSKSSTAAAIKLWDSAEKLPKKPGVSWENGALKISSGSVYQSTPTYRDSVARVSVQLNPDARRPEVWLRKHSATNSGYKIAVDVPGRKVSAKVATDGVERLLSQWPLARVYAPNEWLKLEFRAIGDELTVLADGKVLGTLHDSTRSQPGGLMLYAEANGYFRDIEYVPLDAPAVSPAPNLPVSKSSDPKFPPGQWVKLFTKPEDLPADLRKPDSGVTWEDGWIRISSTERKRFDLPRELGKNMAVRLRAKRSADATAITLRYNAKTDSRYVMMPGSDARLLVEKVQSTQHNPIIAAKNAALNLGDEYTFEFGVVGKQLVGRFSETFVRTVEDLTFPDGTAYISGAEDIRDIEVINLDGLPEAEALRLLGVDEQGHDLRGKTGAGK